MFLAKLSIKRPVMMTMVLSVFLIFGYLSYTNLNLNSFPEVDIPFVTIQTIYPGAGPKEIETQITKKLEDAVSTVSEIERIESFSLDGVSIIMIEFKLSKDPNVASREVKDKVDVIINKLPEDAMKPLIQKFDFGALPIVDVVLSGDLDSRELFEIADKTLKDRFSQIQGVANVNIVGGQEREIQVNMTNRTVYENAISLPQMLQILKVQNMDIPGGYFNINDQEYTVRLEGKFPDLETMKNLEIPTPYGPKKLSQFADVTDGGKKVRQRAVYYNSKTGIQDDNVVLLSIVKSSDGNVVDVAETIKESLPEIENLLPAGCKLEITRDNSLFVKSTVNDTLSNILLGVLFTSIVLLIFLHDLRATLIVAMSMPTSIISTFMLIGMFDMSLNVMSLMGISVSIGVLVANSVVVLENIFRHKAMGKKRKKAAYEGTSEVTVAVLAATLTNLVVFIPIANMSSMVGMFLAELALAASFATIFSLIMSFTLTPMLAALILPKELKPSKIGKMMDGFDVWYANVYKKMLAFVLKSKILSFTVIAVSFALTFGIIYYIGPDVGTEFMPVQDQGAIEIKAELPEGTNLDETAKIMTEIEDIIKQHPEVVHILTTLGKQDEMNLGTNLAKMDVKLVDVSEREIGISGMVSLLMKDLASVSNAKIKVQVQDEKGGGNNDPIQLFVMGQDLERLEYYKEIVAEKLKDIKGLNNFDNSSRSGKPEITIFPNRKMLSDAGLTVMDVALTVRASIEGIVSSQFRQSGNEYDILVTLDDESVNTPEKIANIPIVSRTGTFRLSQLAEVKFTNGFSKILHRDKFTAIMFSGANAPSEPLGNITDEITRRMDEIEFESGYGYKWGGMTKMMNEMQADFAFAFLLAILLTYMLLTAILESFVQPIFILLTIPLAMSGVMLSLYWFDISLGITSMMAIVMLIGIVVNNAILMLDYTNILYREKGYDVREALVEACGTKLKPILMSSVAIILGMLPMALGIGDAGREMRIPLGVVSIAGLISSTILGLFVIPSFYLLWMKISDLIRGIFKKDDELEEVI